METLTIGSVPYAEPCAQVGSEDYARRARAQCKAFIAQLERSFPCPCPDKAWLFIKSNPHDFGTYYEVEVKFDQRDAQAEDWAYMLEAGAPEYWDAQAREELLKLNAL